MAAGDKKSSGQRFTPPPATLWNAMVAAGESHLSGQLSQQRGPQHRQRDANRIKCRNDSGADRKRGEILGAFTNPLTGLHADDLRLAGGLPGTDGSFGVLLKATPEDEYGELQVSGVCIALVMIDDETHTRARVGGGEYALKSSTEGPVAILFSPEDTGIQECVIKIDSGFPPQILYKFEITSTFDPIHHDATVATANLTPITGGDPDNGAILRDPERIFTGIPDGARGLAMLQGGNYYIIQAACPEEEEPEE